MLYNRQEVFTGKKKFNAFWILQKILINEIYFGSVCNFSIHGNFFITDLVSLCILVMNIIIDITKKNWKWSQLQ